MSRRGIFTLRNTPAVVSASSGTTLIDRYAGRDDHATELRYANPEHFPIDVRLFDTSEVKSAHWTPTSDGIWHVLWIRDEPAATATVTLSGTGSTWPIAPGDTLMVPAGASVAATGGHLALAISSTQPGTSTTNPAPPTHGEDRFFGYNRQTIYPAFDSIVPARWKLTQPLNLSDHYRDMVMVISLAGDPALVTTRESLTLRRGRAALVQVNEAATILPNGLGYVFVIALPQSGY